MKHGGSFFLVLIFIFSSCAPTSGIKYDSESLAGYHMERGDSLEVTNQLSDAVFEYKLVAELYPRTSHYPKAVRNAAILYSNPANPSVNDNLSMYWFERYLTLPISRDERARTEVYVSMLNRLRGLRKELNRNTVTIDSLQTVSRRQSGDLATRNKRVQDLETELKQATVEMQRLRELDVRINRRKGGK